jgi:lipopolysaccharide assembly protein A
VSSFYLILALIFSLLIAIVAVANNDSVTVNYIFGRSEISLILLILGSAFSGALVMGLISLFRTIRSALAFREMRHQKDLLQKKINSLEEEKLFLEAELSRHTSVQGDDQAESFESSSDENALAADKQSPESDRTVDEEVENNHS